jgi:hypothetical protein
MDSAAFPVNGLTPVMITYLEKRFLLPGFGVSSDRRIMHIGIASGRVRIVCGKYAGDKKPAAARPAHSYRT